MLPTVKLLPNVTVPELVLLTEKLYSVKLVVKVNVPRLPEPLIIKLLLAPPLKAPAPETIPLIVQLRVLDVFNLNCMPDPMLNIFEMLVLVVLDNVFLPEPLSSKL